MEVLLILGNLIFALVPFILIVVLIVWMAKKGMFSTKASPQITMREGESSLLAIRVVWMQKAMYLNKRRIPNGVLDITNQRVVYTRLSGDKVDFALEKDDIASVVHRGKIGVKIRAKNGTDYVINIMPPTKVEEAMAQMGIPVER